MKKDVDEIQKASQDFIEVLERAIAAAKTHQAYDKQEYKQAKQVYDSVLAEIEASRTKQADEINVSLKRGDKEPYNKFRQEYEAISACMFRVFDKENKLSATDPHLYDEEESMTDQEFLEFLDNLKKSWTLHNLLQPPPLPFPIGTLAQKPAFCRQTGYPLTPFLPPLPRLKIACTGLHITGQQGVVNFRKSLLQNGKVDYIPHWQWEKMRG